MTKNFANLFNIDEYRQRPREQQADMLINILDEILDNERGTYGFYQLYLDELLDDGEQSDMRQLMEDQYQLVMRLLLHCTNVVLNQILD